MYNAFNITEKLNTESKNVTITKFVWYKKNVEYLRVEINSRVESKKSLSVYK